ncbi:MAG: hypothetical protein P8Y95_04430 [Gammaproteobacteria bacterium]|jgi:hypothetical protein
MIAFSRSLAPLMVSAIAALPAHVQSSECRELDHVLYGPPAIVSVSDRIVISDASASDLPASAPDGAAEERSPHGTARLILMEKPDFMQEGAWNTKLAVLGNRARPLGLTIEIRDHANNPVHTQWLSEKLLFLRVWWGRIVSTDLVLDVETGDPVYAEEANYQSLILPCEAKEQQLLRQRAHRESDPPD